MNLQQLINEVGGNVELKKATVEGIEFVPGINLVVRVRIQDPGPVSVTRVDTWLAKTDDGDEVKCILQPHRFNIMLVTEFAVRGGTVFPESGQNLIDAILAEVKVGDALQVLHIMPAKHPGKYVS